METPRATSWTRLKPFGKVPTPGDDLAGGFAGPAVEVAGAGDEVLDTIWRPIRTEETAKTIVTAAPATNQRCDRPNGPGAASHLRRPPTLGASEVEGSSGGGSRSLVARST
ncbi:MAG: hypothetical protein M3Z33_12625 [Actinomycetota bacterium]|nr:hypothetical protein [Actinomycetota bacterium]